MSRQGDFFADAPPSFARPGAAQGRIAVIDVGSNSVRLVVFDGAGRAPAYFFNEKVACGLGARIARTGALDPEGVARALETLGRFSELARRMHVAGLDAVATAAVREARDGADFCAEVRRRTGLSLRVISGDEEARLSALGVLVGEPKAEGAMADMGGSSMELAALGGGAVGARTTLALGPQRLDGLSGAALAKAIDGELRRSAMASYVRGRTLHLVGGAWRAFARIQMARTGHPLHVLHGHAIEADAAAEAAEWVAAQSPEALRALSGVSAARATTAPLAARVLARMLAVLAPARLAISAFGLREGAYFEQLPPEVRDRDPLIEAARVLEATQARFPGFGEELARWSAPLAAEWTKRERRLNRAACLLNDVNWRAHPDYRATSCFETVTRANLAGLDHADRVYLGYALMQRYGGGGPMRPPEIERALALMADDGRQRAKALGRAMRLGAMLSASTPGALADAALTLDDGAVSLTLGPSAHRLNGELVARRLGALADALGRTPRVVA
ncbi:MAG: exopolyphosphatase [Rubrimonas sp.]|uniref:Ppx/GppA phosphatase family protein n=1 Tax=Rubrimonas sp. TaxID=2036015 RepID=UPI002FDE6CBB